MSQCDQCPLVWKNHSRTLNNRINGLHKKALGLVYNDFSATTSLAKEIFKVKTNMTTDILTEIFPQKESNYSLRNSTTLQGRSIKAVIYGSETVSRPKIWNILPTELKRIVSPSLFTKKIREWLPKKCPCRLCKTYVENAGFV